MSFFGLVEEATALLRQHGRLSYRALKRQFGLDDAQLEDLKFELTDVLGVAVDQDGTVLVWNATAATIASPGSSAGPPDSPPAKGAPATRAAERRQLSVLFCDVVGSTPLSTALDPEELRDVLTDYQVVCSALVERFDGVITRQVGDGLLVNFGYPDAHEDDAERAVRAGLAIVAAMPELNDRIARRRRAQHAPPAPPMQVRIGIHTGLVVVGALGDGTYRDPMAVTGDTPSVATRLQTMAAPDTLMVSAATHRLVKGTFVCEDLGPHTLPGIAAPMSVYRVRGEQELDERSALVSTGRSAALIGREHEVGVLLARWQESQEGLGQAVLLTGEAGIGKSRLVQEIKAHIAGHAHVRLEGRGSPYHRQTAFYPFCDLLKRALEFDRDDGPEAKREKLDGMLRRYGLAIGTLSPILVSLLGLPPAAASNPQHQRQQILDALVALALQMSGQHPALMIIEDLHWADPSSLEVLDLLLEQVPTARLLLVLTARAEFTTPWARCAHLTRLTLTRLRRAQVERLVVGVSGGRTLPPEVLEQVVHKTDGVPLFVEELTKMVLESELVREGAAGYELAGPLPPLAIPTTLQDSLMARLDRLSTTKVVAQYGAVLGRSFTYELLHAVTRLDETTLREELGKLVQAELLHPRGQLPHATYSFKHALIQDTAYQTLLRSTRQQYHQRIAQVLETQFPETVDTTPEVLAHHHTEAGNTERAVEYWWRAGQRALECSANLEAIDHLERGMRLLATCAETSRRVEQELKLQIPLAAALRMTRGYGAPEVKRAYARALELSKHGADSEQVVAALFGFWRWSFTEGQLPASREIGAQLLELAQRAEEPAFLVAAHYALGLTLSFLGEWAAARVHLETARDLYDPDRRHRSAQLFGSHDPRVVCLAYLTRTLWHLGSPQQAVTASEESIALARTLSNRFMLAFALSFAARLHQLRRDSVAARERAAEAIALSTQHGFPHWRATGMILGAWAEAMADPAPETIEQIEDGIAAAGINLSWPYWLGLKAEAYKMLGRPTAGLPAVAEALDRVGQTGERWCEPELYRLQGELLLAAHDDGRAPGLTPDGCFSRALEIARRQGARSVELRAAASLARLWQSRGERAAAHGLLAPIYAAFTEGFDTADLEEARLLLTTLAESAPR